MNTANALGPASVLECRDFWAPSGESTEPLKQKQLPLLLAGSRIFY